MEKLITNLKDKANFELRKQGKSVAKINKNSMLNKNKWQKQMGSSDENGEASDFCSLHG